MVIQVLLDTNFLIYCTENKIDYVEEIDRILKQGNELLVLDQVINELKDISNRKQDSFKNRQKAELSLKILEANKIKIIPSKANNADDSIVYFSKKNPNNIVATLDKNLKKRINKEKTRFIVLNGKKSLSLQ